jgi:hypothetical protein
MPPARISTLESGRSSPKLEEVLRLAAAFGMGLEELVLGEEGAKRYQAVQLARLPGERPRALECAGSGHPTETT